MRLARRQPTCNRLSCTRVVAPHPPPSCPSPGRTLTTIARLTRIHTWRSQPSRCSSSACCAGSRLNSSLTAEQGTTRGGSSPRPKSQTRSCTQRWCCLCRRTSVCPNSKKPTQAMHSTTCSSPGTANPCSPPPTPGPRLTLHLAAPCKGAVKGQLLLHPHPPAANAGPAMEGAKKVGSSIATATAAAAAAWRAEPLDRDNVRRGGPQVDAAQLKKWV